METSMTPSRPYLLRAFYEWLLDNNMTPHLLVDANARMVQVPQQFARDGQIVLNIAPQAVVAFTMDNEMVSFNARFGGVPQQVYIPMAAVLAIHARENGTGTFFPPEPAYAAWQEDDKPVSTDVSTSASDGDEPPPPRPDGRPTLRVIK
jgi:stringent starvation protein B